ncbi:glycerol-3-phosphate acyltransferase PlsY [Bacillus sp. SORGH_AS 510]|uniref:glycerol-3-phosphate acyltransferase n=1 Tax=Bacillus sp. SORGH_AS_0510 TaxID=3041771 RepID=UPI002786BF93|nr:glycerol-3-phosphate acyltransferase [Bacillus sp. SORGH_AS_0510]MDQ1144268.1 glycerol-3-phosphate acyltransferase PlsY [Bacillus sp. SORGH_AS_0510]
MIYLYLVICYFIGCIMFGYLVTKMIYHKDIRLHGSGNVGARNAGRLHGKKAFALIFLGDALKGVLVISLARYLEFSGPVQLLGLGMAIIGHLKPITLKFKGGKGISTFIGGMVMFEPLLIPVIIIGFIILYPLTKSFTFAGLGVFLLIPVFLVINHSDWISCVISGSLLVIILLAHAGNIKERLKK